MNTNEDRQFIHISELANKYNADTYDCILKIENCTYEWECYAVLNFENIEKATELAEKLGSIAKVAYFKKKDGGKWEYDGIFFKKYTIDNWLEAYGSGFSIAKDPRKDTDGVSMRMKEIADDFNGDFNELQEFIDDQNEIIAEIDSCDLSHEVVVWKDKFFEKIPTEMMGFYYNSYQYQIGVFVEPFDIA